MMLRLLHSDVLQVAARLIVGFVFLVASLEKIVDPAAFALSIDNYQVLPAAAIPLLATVLPWIELLAGLALLAGVYRDGGALLAAGMMLVFIAAVTSALARGLDISCGCFTQDPAAATMGWSKLLENTGLFLLSVSLLFSRSRRFSVENSNLLHRHRRDGTSPTPGT